ncbi:kelch domain-containing protein 7A isoform X2 [Artibeus jamaicensis]|uniref:kelch domain-containing protein 7A isoform X2 n=1 Tax=Artibeus jamaicensis TaxID=9417 RepID=UPI00235A4AAD|nr:kelch domain-containing protein 7A isoform X2 [Artibeus jamaicensis]
MLPGGGGGAEAQDWHLDMQLTGKVVLSAAALLLVTVAYRLYKSRPSQAPLWDRNTKAKAEEEAEGSRQPEVQGDVPGAPRRRLRCRRGSKEPGALPGYSWDSQRSSQVLATAASSSDSEAERAWKPERKGSGEDLGRRCLESGLAPPRCSGQEAGTAAASESELPHRPHQGSEPRSSPPGLASVDGSGVEGESAPWREGGHPKQPGTGAQGPPRQPWMAYSEDKSDVNKSWLFTRGTGVSGEGAGALRAASDMGLALRQQEGATNASYTFSSVARVRVEENFIREKVEGIGPWLQGKVYEYHVESTSQATSKGRPAPRTAALAEAPPPVPGPLGIGAVPGGHHDDTEGGADPAASSQPVLSPPGQGFSRKDSLLQIVENPELQLQLNGFGSPAPSCPARSAPPSSPTAGQLPESGSAGSSGEPNLQLVAGTNFFHFPLTPGSAPEVHLDLGNCYEVLTLAKRKNLEALKEAAYKVMSDNYLQVLRSPDIYGRLSGAERELVLQRRLRGCKRLVVADMCPQEDSGRLCCYDDEQDVWLLLTHLPPEAVSRGCAICSLFNYVFVVSGCQGSRCRPSNRVFCYNPLTEIWSEVCPLNQARPHCQLVALDGYLYAIGGECLNTVERYDPRLDRWTFAPPLPNDTFALAHTATACAGDIFVTGGTLRYLLLRFSTQEQRWQVGPTAGGKDRTAEMVAVNGFLYRFDLNRSLGIGVYRCSASARLWYECATYRTPYPDAFQCAVVDNLIYCVGRRRTLLFLADHVSPRNPNRQSLTTSPLTSTGDSQKRGSGPAHFSVPQLSHRAQHLGHAREMLVGPDVSCLMNKTVGCPMEHHPQGCRGHLVTHLRK